MTNNEKIANTLNRMLDPNCPWGRGWEKVIEEAVAELRKGEKKYQDGFDAGIIFMSDAFTRYFNVDPIKLKEAIEKLRRNEN